MLIWTREVTREDKIINYYKRDSIEVAPKVDKMKLRWLWLFKRGRDGGCNSSKSNRYMMNERG